MLSRVITMATRMVVDSVASRPRRRDSGRRGPPGSRRASPPRRPPTCIRTYPVPQALGDGLGRLKYSPANRADVPRIAVAGVLTEVLASVATVRHDDPTAGDRSFQARHAARLKPTGQRDDPRSGERRRQPLVWNVPQHGHARPPGGIAHGPVEGGVGGNPAPGDDQPQSRPLDRRDQAELVLQTRDEPDGDDEVAQPRLQSERVARRSGERRRGHLLRHHPARAVTVEARCNRARFRCRIRQHERGSRQQPALLALERHRQQAGQRQPASPRAADAKAQLGCLRERFSRQQPVGPRREPESAAAVVSEDSW